MEEIKMAKLTTEEFIAAIKELSVYGSVIPLAGCRFGTDIHYK